MGFGARVLGTALLVGIGAVVIAGIVAAPTILRTTRPLVREGLRRGLGAYERARAAASEFADDVEDLVAEVRADLPRKSAADGDVKQA